MVDTLPPRYEVEELARRGDEIYDRDILPKLRPEDKGKIVAIGRWPPEMTLVPCLQQLLERGLTASVFLLYCFYRIWTWFGIPGGWRESRVLQLGKGSHQINMGKRASIGAHDP